MLLTASISGQHSSSCGGCFDVYYLSMIGVVGRSSIDMHGSPISKNEAVLLKTMTQEIGTFTVDAHGKVNGHFSSAATEVIPSPPGDGYTVVDGTTERYGSAYLSALSTIVPDYTSWQTVMDAGICIETSQVISLKSTVTFFDGDITQNSYNQIFGSAIAARLPRPTCTSTFVEVSTTRSIPTFKAAAQAATTETSDALDALVTTAAKGVAFGFSIWLILGCLLFFLWRRHKTDPKQTQTRSSLGQRQSDSVTSQSRGDYGQVRELSVLEAMADPSKHEPKISWESYWKAPACILGGIFVGTVFALGLQFLYTGINMQPVDEISLSQVRVIPFWTPWVLLIKLCFAMSVISVKE